MQKIGADFDLKNNIKKQQQQQQNTQMVKL